MIDPLRALVARTIEALNVAELWLANSVPTCDLPNPKPLPVIRAARAELDALLSAPVGSGWQPIETAPRPTRGRRKIVDLWCVTDDIESAKFYFGETYCGVKDEMLWQGRVCEAYWLDGAWRPAIGLRMHGLTVTPTHWMPLPASPGSAPVGSPPPPDQDQESASRGGSVPGTPHGDLPRRTTGDS